MKKYIYKNLHSLNRKKIIIKKCILIKIKINRFLKRTENISKIGLFIYDKIFK